MSPIEYHTSDMSSPPSETSFPRSLSPVSDSFSDPFSAMSTDVFTTSVSHHVPSTLAVPPIASVLSVYLAPSDLSDSSGISPPHLTSSPVRRLTSTSSPKDSTFSLISPLNEFFNSLPHSSSRLAAFSAFSELRRSIPPSPTNPYTPLQLASVWLTEQFSQNPFVQLGSDNRNIPPDFSFLYKKVANKTRPVATTLPENFRIIRHEHPNPLQNLRSLPTHPPEFSPTGRFTQERRNAMDLGKDFLTPEEVKIAEWIVCTHNSAFAWTDEERGSFDPQYFAPIEIPHISHVPWVLRQGPIPRGILSEVIKIIEDKWRSGVYEPSSSSYNSRWFCVFKKDGKSLRLVHSLEPLNAVTVRNAAMPPYTDVVTEDFARRSIYTTLDLYVSFDQRQLHENSRDMTTFNTPLGSFRLTVLPMGWTNSPAVLQGDVRATLAPAPAVRLVTVPLSHTRLQT